MLNYSRLFRGGSVEQSIQRYEFSCWEWNRLESHLECHAPQLICLWFLIRRIRQLNRLNNEGKYRKWSDFHEVLIIDLSIKHRAQNLTKINNPSYDQYRFFEIMIKCSKLRLRFLFREWKYCRLPVKSNCGVLYLDKPIISSCMSLCTHWIYPNVWWDKQSAAALSVTDQAVG